MHEDLPGGIEPTMEAIVLHEEEVDGVDRGWRGVGVLRARKHNDAVAVREVVPVATEELDGERIAVEEDDSGRIETLADGSVSIPIYAEELVITKRVVLKERLVLRKRTVVEELTVDDSLRYERVELDVDDEVADRVELPEGDAR